MFGNTSLPRECFFAPVRFHSTKAKSVEASPGEQSNGVLKSRRGVIEAQSVN